MASESDPLIKALDGSGFPFQIGVRKEIEATLASHGWEVDAEEHHWRHPGTGGSGFADLVISHRNYCQSAVLECKRVKEGGRWLFLSPRDYKSETHRISAFCVQEMAAQAQPPSAWYGFNFNPVSPESSYCVFAGQDEKSPLLERIADDLLSSVEAIGLEYIRVDGISRAINARIFLPIIVTNVDLYTGVFDASRVNMSTGRLEPGDCEFQKVPLVRFRKSLATHYSKASSGHRPTWSLSSTSSVNEITILVISASHLADVLKELVLPDAESRTLYWALQQLKQTAQAEAK